MECTIRWQPEAGMAFTAETGSGHLLTMDGAADGGGRNLAPRPMETVLAGTGGCTAYDVLLILRRGRHAVTGCELKLSAERAETEPKVFTAIHMHFIVTGRGVPESAVQRAIQLSLDRYCSASAMLAKTAGFTTSRAEMSMMCSTSTRWLARSVLPVDTRSTMASARPVSGASSMLP